jgi:uncharacterized protein (DUF1330 family)
MSESFINPSSANIAALRAMDPVGPVVMLNLLRFRPDGGAEQYERYAAAATPFLAKAGATLRYLGDGVATVIGPDHWDEILLVEYPTVQAFFDMTSDPEYPSDLRAEGLADSRLYCTQQRRSS